MITKIFIGGLVPETDEMMLAELVGPYGDMVTMKLVRDKQTRKFKGYAFVEMTDLKSADLVMDALDGKMVNGKELTVNIIPEQIAQAVPNYQKVERSSPPGKAKRPRLKR